MTKTCRVVTYGDKPASRERNLHSTKKGAGSDIIRYNP